MNGATITGQGGFVVIYAQTNTGQVLIVPGVPGVWLQIEHRRQAYQRVRDPILAIQRYPVQAIADRGTGDENQGVLTYPCTATGDDIRAIKVAIGKRPLPYGFAEPLRVGLDVAPVLYRNNALVRGTTRQPGQGRPTVLLLVTEFESGRGRIHRPHGRGSPAG